MRQRFAQTVCLFIALGISMMPPEVIDALDRAKIGDVVLVRLPSGDGCNSCEHGFRKTEEGMFQRLGMFWCTLARCLPPEIPVERYK
jgi:hypothetical protein